MLRIGINGFGRIGRQVLKAMLERHPKRLEVVAVNDLFDVETNANLFQYDTNYGKFPKKVAVRGDTLQIGKWRVKSFPAATPRKSRGTRSGRTWWWRARGCSAPDPWPPPTWRPGPRR